VYRKLRRAIVQGDLAQGASVSQTELARRLDVSKTPVRHALTRLVQEGLLVSTPHKGAVVTSLTSRDLQEIHCLRSRLEGVAARTAAERLTDEDAKVLSALLAELRAATAARDAEAVRRGCVQLHKAIWQASQTRRLPAILTSLQDYAEMARDTQLDRPPGFEAGLEEHAQVVQAILARDADQAEQAMTRHVAHALDLHHRAAARAGGVGQAEALKGEY
jgi:DNA-binding GntR family transcriptional regulator